MYRITTQTLTLLWDRVRVHLAGSYVGSSVECADEGDIRSLIWDLYINKQGLSNVR